MPRRLGLVWLALLAVACTAGSEVEVGPVAPASTSARIGGEATTSSVAMATSMSAPVDLRPLTGRLLTLPGWLIPRGGHSVIWTGSELIVWGGWSDERATTSFADGAAYDPADGSWRQLPPSNLDGRAYHEAAWTGSEMLIVGGQSEPGRVVVDGGAYDPGTGTWRAIPDVGIEHEATSPPPVESAWTGNELVIWYRGRGTVVAYSPDRSSWSSLPDLDLPGARNLGALHWTGIELVALAGEGPGVMSAATLRPGRNADWIDLPPVDFGRAGAASDPFPSNSSVAAGRLVVWSRSGSEAPSFMLDLDGRRWEEIPTVPVAACEGHMAPLSMGTQLLVMDTCVGTDLGGAALFDAEARTWEVVQTGPDGQANLGEAVWTGTEALVVETTCCFGAGDRPFEWSGTRYLVDRLSGRADSGP